MKQLYRHVLVTMLLLASYTHSLRAEDLVESFPEAAARAHIAIIIDDLGYGLKQGEKLASIPFDITYAIIPFTPYGQDIAQIAHTHHYEVMLHAPMETLTQTKWEKSLNNSMNKAELIQMMEEMVLDIPYVKGVNNHGGSKFTQDSDRMAWVMEYLANKNMYFIDSRTTAQSKAAQAAEAANIRHRSRDVFLDNNKDPELISLQLEKLHKLALQQGYAIGIGHPYPETLDVLSQMLPKLTQQGVFLVSISKLLMNKKYKNEKMLKNQ